MVYFIHIPKNAGSSIKSVCDNTSITYCYHRVNVFTQNIPNQLVILRNPIDRFQSSVKYCIEQYKDEPQIKKLLEVGCDTPEKWIQAWKNPNHPHHSYVMNEIRNKKKKHKIGHFRPHLKWTYCPQAYWVNHPKYVLIMENLKIEWSYFKDKVLNSVLELPLKNSTSNRLTFLSENSLRFLKKIYALDFKLYDNYRNLPIEQRIPFD